MQRPEFCLRCTTSRSTGRLTQPPSCCRKPASASSAAHLNRYVSRRHRDVLATEGMT